MRHLALVLLVLPAPALAQAYQCNLPQRIEPVRPSNPDGPARRAAIGSYTLGVSWTPEYCRGNRDANSIQCSGRYGRFGLVLHGLWPEAERGPAPQWCSITPQPSPDLLRQNLCMTPVPWMLEHEWAKHGSCMSPTPEAYFRTSRILWDSLRWPDLDQLSRREGLTVGDLRRAFVIANPAWRSEQIGVLLSDRGWLRELRLCYSRRFMPAACSRGRYGPADSAALKVWRGL